MVKFGLKAYTSPKLMLDGVVYQNQKEPRINVASETVTCRSNMDYDRNAPVGIISVTALVLKEWSVSKPYFTVHILDGIKQPIEHSILQRK